MNNNSRLPSQHNIPNYVRRASHSKTSSASCANAKPSEDWTKMTDLAERRRVQNRIAQRNYRQKLKKRLERAGELEKRAVSTSPPSTNALLSGSLSSPETRNRSLSTGATTNANFAPQPHMPLFQELFPQQYVSAEDSQFPAVSEGYLKQPMTPTLTPLSYSVAGYSQPVPASYTSFPQGTSFADLPALSAPYISPLHQVQYSADGSPMTTGGEVTPITPTSQGDCYSVNDRPSYAINFGQTYGNQQFQPSETYTDSAASVNYSDFFRQNYPSS